MWGGAVLKMPPLFLSFWARFFQSLFHVLKRNVSYGICQLNYFQLSRKLLFFGSMQIGNAEFGIFQKRVTTIYVSCFHLSFFRVGLNSWKKMVNKFEPNKHFTPVGKNIMRPFKMANLIVNSGEIFFQPYVSIFDRLKLHLNFCVVVLIVFHFLWGLEFCLLQKIIDS